MGMFFSPLIFVVQKLFKIMIKLMLNYLFLKETNEVIVWNEHSLGETMGADSSNALCGGPLFDM